MYYFYYRHCLLFIALVFLSNRFWYEKYPNLVVLAFKWAYSNVFLNYFQWKPIFAVFQRLWSFKKKGGGWKRALVFWTKNKYSKLSEGQLAQSFNDQKIWPLWPFLDRKILMGDPSVLLFDHSQTYTPKPFWQSVRCYFGWGQKSNDE